MITLTVVDCFLLNKDILKSTNVNVYNVNVDNLSGSPYFYESNFLFSTSVFHNMRTYALHSSPSPVSTWPVILMTTDGHKLHDTFLLNVLLCSQLHHKTGGFMM